MKRQKDNKNKLLFKNKSSFLFLILIIIIGLIISMIGIYLVSQQKRVKELKFQKELTLLLEKTRDSIREKVIFEINGVFESFSKLKNNNYDHLALINDIKKKKEDIKYIRNPFLINKSAMLVYPYREVPVLPLKETPDEVLYFKDARLMMPFKLNIKKSLFSNQTFFNIKSQDLYKKGLVSEFQDKKYLEAVKYYKRAILTNKRKDLAPILYNSIGRCYYKSKNKKKISIYLMLLKRFDHLLRNDLEYLKIRIYRSLALLAIRQGDRSKAIVNFLNILEQILYKTKNRKEIFVFFKHEAIDFLNQQTEKNFGKILKLKFEKLKKKEKSQSHSLLDLELKAACSGVFERNSLKRNKKINMILEKIFVTYQERLHFYFSLKDLYNWGAEGNSSLNVIESDPDDIKRKYSLCFKKIQKKQKNEDPDYFGFIFDQKKYNKDNILSDINEELIQKGFIVQFTDNSIDSRFKYPVMSIKFKKFFHWNSLVLYSDIDNYINKKIKKEMWINYVLIVVLILFFILFTFMFYKYISREAELLKLKSNFVDSVSHTLKTPLTRISLLAENVAGEWVKDDEKKKEFLNTIVTESYKMNDMINNMLNFSKIDAGKKVYDLKDDSIYEIVEAVIENYSEYIKKLGFELLTSIDFDIPNFKIDREAIKLILINLLQNAIKYSGKEKYIKISLKKIENLVKLEIEDHGFGIPFKEQKKIFEKYYRTQSKQIRSLEGSGLGLYLIKDAVKAHKGDISVKSDLGKGTVFTIIFPLDRT